jgi:phosphomannomutase
MTKRLIAFDLDNTLAESKSPISDQIAGLLDRLLGRFEVCVISGGKYEQFQQQLLPGLKTTPEGLRTLHLMPTCGTRYYRFDVESGAWVQVYAEDLGADEKARAVDALNRGADALGYRDSRLWGAQIEDRGSQITFSALGQDAPIASKEAWDPDGEKRRKLRDYVAKLIPDLGVRVGGSTSIDVTKHGIDKAFGTPS